MSETEAETVADSSLREADRQLGFLADVCLDEDGDVPAWVVAARQAVQQARRRDSHA